MSKIAQKKKKIRKDCWALDDAFIKWLDDRLPVYLHDAGKIVDLTFYEIDGITQEQAIKQMIELTHDLRHKDDWDADYEEKRLELMKLWTQWMPAMWW